MKEVVIIKTRNSNPTYESLSWRYACILGYCKKIEIELKKRRRDTGILLDNLLELKSDLKCLEQALNGKYNIIVVMDSTSDDSITEIEKF